jgi:hypothetical protein
MKLKVAKLKASDYRDFAKLYDRLGLIKTIDGQKGVDVSKVFVSNKDMKKFELELVKLAKKKGFTKKGLKLAVGMEMLNLSPSSLLGDVIKEGFVLVLEE